MEDDVLKKLEKNLAVCKTCNKLCQRNFAGKWNSKDKRYSDEFGMWWNGKVCGRCCLERVRVSMSKMREKRKAEKQIIFNQGTKKDDETV